MSVYLFPLEIVKRLNANKPRTSGRPSCLWNTSLNFHIGHVPKPAVRLHAPIIMIGGIEYRLACFIVYT